MNQLLSEKIKISVAITVAEGVAAATDLEGAIIDMAGYDSVLMIARLGTITAGAVTGLTAEVGDALNLSDKATATGSALVVAEADSDKYFAVDLGKITKRYARLHVDRATQNAVIEHALYLQYNAKDFPDGLGFEDVAKVATA